jgi:hypothetical protein
MPCDMNQRPSLVWQMPGEWFGVSAAWRLVRRHNGTRRMTQYMMSCSGFFDTASWIATETSCPRPLLCRSINAAMIPVANCSPAM